MGAMHRHRRQPWGIFRILCGYALLLAPHHDAEGTPRLTGPRGDTAIVIHYGLNDSHSQDWAKLSGNGDIGITYFQREPGSYEEGRLLYKAIHPDQAVTIDCLDTGGRLEKSVLLYDQSGDPHVFLAQSTDQDQIIDHFYRNDGGQWGRATILHFFAEGGKFIYELSADTGPDGSFHLLILKTRSNIDSDDFMEAWRDANLYYVTNATGNWRKELIHHYNMAYTYDMYVKTSCRQDIDVDADGFVHVTFSEQLTGAHDPSRLLYATNRNGSWAIEVALSNIHGPRDDAGWFPSLCLDNNGTPHISCMYVNRVMTYSATYATLYLLTRMAPNSWTYEIVASYDDGYHGTDGRDYTGGLTHLVFDSGNRPHLVFSDIASSHWPVLNQRWNVGNIRYGTHRGGTWDLRTVYRQPLPEGFYDATEMFGLCMILSEATDTIRAIGQELEVNGESQYSCRLVEFAWAEEFVSVDSTDHDRPLDDEPSRGALLCSPASPFQPGDVLEYSLHQGGQVQLSIATLTGGQVCRLVSGRREAGNHRIAWNTHDSSGQSLPSGVYVCTLRILGRSESRRILLIR